MSQKSDRRGREIATSALGERVAAHRARAGFRVSELAREIGVSPSLISQIERGQSQPSVSTLFALAKTLNVPVDAFFDRERDGEPEQAANVVGPAGQPPPSSRGELDAPGSQRYVVRRDRRASIDIEGGVRWERLTPETLAEIDFMELVYAPGAESHSELYRHPGSEMVLVLDGTLTVFVGFDRCELAVGDSIHFPSTVPHRYVNESETEARAVTVILHDGTREVEASGRP